MSVNFIYVLEVVKSRGTSINLFYSKKNSPLQKVNKVTHVRDFINDISSDYNVKMF